VKEASHDFRGADHPVRVLVDASRDVRLEVIDTLREGGFDVWPRPSTGPYECEIAMHF
jgi:hypothetical protein